jgi:hypothetical protein
MKKQKLLIKMMIDVLEKAEDNHLVFSPEIEYKERERIYNFKKRERIYNQIKFVWRYWLQEDIPAELTDDHYFTDNISDFEYFFTNLVYDRCFSFSSKLVKKEFLINNKNQFTAIIKRLKEKI